jgi:hypothetical protein
MAVGRRRHGRLADSLDALYDLQNEPLLNPPGDLRIRFFAGRQIFGRIGAVRYLDLKATNETLPTSHMKTTYLIAVAVLCFLMCSIAVADARRPNIVLFLVDDMGWMDCGAYGSKYYQTPNIDRFARRALRFTDAYACPLCSPTRASCKASM